MSFKCERCGEFWSDGVIGLNISDHGSWRTDRCRTCELRVFSVALRGFMRQTHEAMWGERHKQTDVGTYPQTLSHPMTEDPGCRWPPPPQEHTRAMNYIYGRDRPEHSANYRGE